MDDRVIWDCDRALFMCRGVGRGYVYVLLCRESTALIESTVFVFRRCGVDDRVIWDSDRALFMGFWGIGMGYGCDGCNGWVLKGVIVFVKGNYRDRWNGLCSNARGVN